MGTGFFIRKPTAALRKNFFLYIPLPRFYKNLEDIVGVRHGGMAAQEAGRKEDKKRPYSE